MPQYQYLIVGGGMTADSAVRAIRASDPNGTVGIISEEPDPPYLRPPLSKGLWKGLPFEEVWCRTAELGVDLHLQRRAVTLDVRDHIVRDDRGTTYQFQKLLLATGGRPRRLQVEVAEEKLIHFRTLDDYRRLEHFAQRAQRFAVVGGGFIGSEIAAALAGKGKQVWLIFPEEGIGRRIFPQDLSLFLNQYYREHGVEVLCGESVHSAKEDGEQVRMLTSGQRTLVVDTIVAGIGIEPEVSLARDAGLPLSNGIAVDEYLRAGHPDIFAAGDVASFFNPHLGKRIRVEHEDNARTMGARAGTNMAGQAEPYDHLPFFYSDLFDLGYEAVGELNGQWPTLAEWKEPFREGVVYYLEGARVRGVLLWNVWGKVEEARTLIAEAGPFGPSDLKGRISW
ncbi:NAD(P)/FAD-dependent oxidoreductase [Candidatus Methylacidithermus pantelleriae]|uniref:Ferredoxin reductase n=1 Tax=Candidatus Methylacidithermus pantelleriae TaxID=2744239 RepID=A0A8J2FRM2_9BACT|nr:FAD-dependent oxidoreductase [Candidatus Methylacidithermus pantelleriae]CAF0700160.1 Ferredoxin reductase [Candidatus Methylacidithermus pantelleriae]